MTNITVALCIVRLMYVCMLLQRYTYVQIYCILCFLKFCELWINLLFFIWQLQYFKQGKEDDFVKLLDFGKQGNNLIYID